MKSAKIVIVMSLVLMAALVVLVACTGANAETEKVEIKHYPACGEVVEINKEDDKVLVEDFNGNLWAFEDVEDWMKGDICAMIMSDEYLRRCNYSSKILWIQLLRAETPLKNFFLFFF